MKFRGVFGLFSLSFCVGVATAPACRTNFESDCEKGSEGCECGEGDICFEGLECI